MNTKRIAGTGVLLALTMVFTSISNYITIGTISINLALIPIALAGILFGPVSGVLTGLLNGAFILLAPSTSGFFAIDVGGTILICLLKGSLTSFISWFAYFLIKKKNELVGMIVSGLLAPIINTGVFILLALVFYHNSFGELISIFVSVNFIIEMAATIVLTPPLARAIKRSNVFESK